MLRELLHLIEENDGELSLTAVGQQLGADPRAVAGMLETLIRKGRVIEIGAGCGPNESALPCESCSLHGHCELPATRARRYKAVS